MSNVVTAPERREEEAMDEEEKRISEIIEKHVAYFNGWCVDDKTMKKDCRDAAQNIISYLKHRQSALLGKQRARGASDE